MRRAKSTGMVLVYLALFIIPVGGLTTAAPIFMVGLCFLFWYGYKAGDFRSEAKRSEHP